MRDDLEFDGYRYSVFATQVLEPAVYPTSAALDVGAYQCEEVISHTEAKRQSYIPVDIGWRWGPAWSSAWFRIRGQVPVEFAGKPVVLRFSSGTEALFWHNGVSQCGLDANHQTAILFDPATGNEEVDLLVEAACNRRLGVTTFWWDEAEIRHRWQEPTPGRLSQCDLAVFDPVVWRLWHTYEFVRQLMLELPSDTQRARHLCDALHEATIHVDDTDVRGSADKALQVLTETVNANPAPSQTQCFAVGHAHIDTAWLWRTRETVRKCQRSFSTVLDLMDRYPQFRFICTQAQQYAWLEEQCPDLFGRIAEKVQTGQWEPGGAMWIEPDCNLPSGESLIRQIIHGTRYWNEKFGTQGAQQYLYLPDSFGFPASLPQIIRLAGLKTFLTNKLSWSETNEFPHVNFRWRGIDGTEVLSHCTPGQDYNATTTPHELLRGEKNSARMDQSRAGIWLQPFGYGDGGGGPTDWAIHYAQLAEHCEGLPRVTLARMDEFCRELHRQYDAQRADGRDWPAWDGELYLELHRGTFTTNAWIKKANRRAEDGLRMAEWLTFGGPEPPTPDDAASAMARLDEAWKLLLLNQFHDVLPGVSIAEVYDDARKEHERIRAVSDSLIDVAIQRWSAQADTRGMREPMIVFNNSSFPQSAVTECEGSLHFVEEVPPLGMAEVDRAGQAPVDPVVATDRTLANGILSATIDDAGRVVSLKHVDSDRDACARQPDGSPKPMNQLVLYDDRPRAWEAWDIDAEYEERAYPVDASAELRLAMDPSQTDGLRGAIEVSRSLGARSRITQRYVLDAGSPRLDIQTRVEWHENRRLLRALFPVDVSSGHATYEIQFGHVERPTHRNTSWDREKFEVCAHRWMDLSEPGFGVALLNDCKYGHSCHENVMGLSLLRSPKFPDPTVDMGSHEFTYSLMAHNGDWRKVDLGRITTGVDQEAELLNTPLLARPLPPDHEGTIQSSWAPLVWRVDGAANVIVSALKTGEVDAGASRRILRLVETHGGRGRVTIDWSLPVAKIECVDLLERHMDQDGLAHDSASRRTTVELRPFQIITLAATMRQ